MTMLTPSHAAMAPLRITFLCILVFVLAVEDGASFTCRRQTWRSVWSSSSSTNLYYSGGAPFDGGGVDEQAVEALQSLVDFHEGRWQGTARSFSVTPDVAAGIVNRKSISNYHVSVKLGIDVQKRDYTLSETMTWNEDEVSCRKISFRDSNMDVDSVDASYSLDATLPDFPNKIAGTDKLKQFMMEQCIAASDSERIRTFAFYGPDENLLRIVVCHESRLEEEKNDPVDDTSPGTLSAQDLIEMQGDVDRLVDKIAGRMNNGSSTTSDNESKTGGEDRVEALKQRTRSSSSGTSALSLAPHVASLLELSSGVWLGDAVIRDTTSVPSSPLQQGKGFGSSSKPAVRLSEPKKFAQWSVGVQKVAWRWMWNFGEEIRQINDVGRSMGAPLDDSLSKNYGGSVCMNEGLSRRIPKDERMVYIDWEGDNVGFLVGSVYIRVPRYSTFDRTRQLRPFFTEFCVFQSAPADPSTENPDEAEMPQVVCSKMSRVYNYEGALTQGSTSFFTLKRFGEETEGPV